MKAKEKTNVKYIVQVLKMGIFVKEGNELKLAPTSMVYNSFITLRPSHDYPAFLIQKKKQRNLKKKY